MTQLGRSSARRSLVVPGRPDSTIELAWGAATDIGLRRRLNEDSYLAESPYFVVADGMGGHASGDIASAAVVARLAESAVDDFTDPESILVGLRAATADITLADDDDSLGVGTTVSGAALITEGSRPYWAVFNIGDSRVYSLVDDQLTQVTTDHSVVQELVDAGLLREDEAATHPNSNVITRAVGFDAEPIADFWLLPVRTGTRLLICSDGLTREIDDDRLRVLLCAEPEPAQAAGSLVEAALDAGGRDNITTVVVDVVRGPDDPATDAPA